MENKRLEIRSKETGFSYKIQIDRREKAMNFAKSMHQVLLGLILALALLFEAQVALAGFNANGVPQNAPQGNVVPQNVPKNNGTQPTPESSTKFNPEPTKNPTNQGDLVPASTLRVNPEALRPNIPAVNYPGFPRYTPQPVDSTNQGGVNAGARPDLNRSYTSDNSVRGEDNLQKNGNMEDIKIQKWDAIFNEIIRVGNEFGVDAMMGKMDEFIGIIESQRTGGWADGDPDGDGLSNGEEYGRDTDPNNPDSDGDGLSDGDEVYGQTDPNNQDSDDDGYTDSAEDFGNSNPNDPNSTPMNTDSDGDGSADAVETAAGTDPDDPESKPDSDDDDSFWSGPGCPGGQANCFTGENGLTEDLITGQQNLTNIGQSENLRDFVTSIENLTTPVMSDR